MEERAFHSHCLREGEKREMSRETMYVKHCMGVNGLEKIILRENRGFSAEVLFSFSDSKLIFKIIFFQLFFNHLIFYFDVFSQFMHELITSLSNFLFKIHKYIISFFLVEIWKDVVVIIIIKKKKKKN